MRRALVLFLCLVPLAVALAACGGDDESGTTTLAADTTATATETETNVTSTDGGTSSTVGCVDVDTPAPGERTADEPEQLDESKTYEVTFDTNCGSFTITLDAEQSPNTVESFVSLARQGFFDDTTFHRIVPGFVIQGGDPTGTGAGGPGYSTADTPPSDASYTHGVVAMAKTQAEPPGTAGSQFFVVTGADVGLPPDYAIIGEVTDGIEVVDAIGQLGGPDELPTQPVVIEKATVTES
jgi:cyclophilin family peptidyl-prolyl cis-trans isomerase